MSKHKKRTSWSGPNSPLLKNCAVCGVEFDAGRGMARKYCGRKCKPSGRIAGSVNKRRWVERIGAEENWTCWLCGEAVDPELYWPSSRAGSVDHVIPAIKGGTDERTNLHLAHLDCNVSRGARDAPAQVTR